MKIDLRSGDCRKILPTLDAESVDAVVCDPPYELGFMGKAWDAAGVSFQAETWAHAYRVLKPGGFLLAFGGTRTHHRIGVAIEDAGFEIRDTIAWIYGQGFPKSLDVSKAIDKAAGAEREVIGRYQSPEGTTGESQGNVAVYGHYEGGALSEITAPATLEAERWQGWGTALKPAFEPIVVGRKPFRGTVIANVLEHGTGAINVDGCRIAGPKGDGNWSGSSGERPEDVFEGGWQEQRTEQDGGGRWPANVVLGHHDDCVPVGTRRVPSGVASGRSRGFAKDRFVYSELGSDYDGEPQTYADEDGLETVEAWDCHPGCPIRLLDEQSGELISGANPTRRGSDKFRDAYGDFKGQEECVAHRGADSGGASRFFYCAKTSRAERNAGLEAFEERRGDYRPRDDDETNSIRERLHGSRPRKNHHPTVKPVAVMRWLVRLVTPPGGTVLDPFMGSGTTGIACSLEGFDFVGVEENADEYLPIARARIAFWEEHGEDALRIVADREQAERRRATVAESGQLDLLSG